MAWYVTVKLPNGTISGPNPLGVNQNPASYRAAVEPVGYQILKFEERAETPVIQHPSTPATPLTPGVGPTPTTAAASMPLVLGGLAALYFLTRKR